MERVRAERVVGTTAIAQHQQGSQQGHCEATSMSYKALDHHLHPREPVAVAAEVASHGAHDTYLVCTAQYSPHPAETERVLVLGLRDGGVQLCADAWVETAAIDNLLGLLSSGHVRKGRCDAMYATAWQVAWAIDKGPLEVWDPRGRILWHQAGALVHRERGLLPHLHQVRAALGAGWVERSLVLEVEGAPSCVVASCSDLKAALDPTYDALDLLTDAAWLVELARELSDRLGVPTTLDPALR